MTDPIFPLSFDMEWLQGFDDLDQPGNARGLWMSGAPSEPGEIRATCLFPVDLDIYLPNPENDNAIVERNDGEEDDPNKTAIIFRSPFDAENRELIGHQWRTSEIASLTIAPTFFPLEDTAKPAFRLAFNPGSAPKRRFEVYRDKSLSKQVYAYNTIFPDIHSLTSLYIKPLRGSDAEGETITLQIRINNRWINADEVKFRLLPVELAPEVLAVNTNFDERKLKDGFAKPDADDTSLQAISGPNAGKIVTTDLHEGFFGLRPGTLPYTETAGAVVKIKKLDKNDPVTGAKQTGHVRMYSAWGDTDSQVLPIELYNPDSLVANDLGPTLYTANPSVPIRYYLEGVKPGKITLEFSYQKGSTSFKHEQEFLVCTQKSRADWLAEITEQIKLETGNAVDMGTYNTTDSFNAQKAKIQQVYRYYEGLHRRTPNVQRWGGLAKQAGCPVYAGLSDAQWGKEGSYAAILIGGGIGAVTLDFFQNVLIHGGHNIFNDLAWQCRAYERSGYYALKHVKDKSLDSGSLKALELDPWLAINKGEVENNVTSVLLGTDRLTRREQEFIVQPAWDRILALPTSTVDTLFSWLAENPLPGRPSFKTSQPGKNIVIYAERWPWIENDILPPWGGMAEGARNTLVNDPLVNAAAPYAWLPVKP